VRCEGSVEASDPPVNRTLHKLRLATDNLRSRMRRHDFVGARIIVRNRENVSPHGNFLRKFPIVRQVPSLTALPWSSKFADGFRALPKSPFQRRTKGCCCLVGTDHTHAASDLRTDLALRSRSSPCFSASAIRALMSLAGISAAPSRIVRTGALFAKPMRNCHVDHRWHRINKPIEDERRGWLATEPDPAQRHTSTTSSNGQRRVSQPACAVTRLCQHTTCCMRASC
jgi:hypothetical protein